MVTRVGVTTGAPASAAAFTPTLPAHQAGDRLVFILLGKSTTASTPTLNQGWGLYGNGTGGTGTLGADAGPVKWTVWVKDAASSAETPPTVTPGATAYDSWVWICVSHRPALGKVWRDPTNVSNAWVKAATDTTTASPLTGTTTNYTQGQPAAGDALFCVGGIPTDLGTALGATTITQAGLSGGTVTAATTQYVENALGNDFAGVWAGWTGFTGTGTAGTAMSFTVTGATNQSGSLVAVALREMDPPSVYLRQSALVDLGAGPYTATLPFGAPLVGSLLVATISERSGATAHAMTSAGWTEVVDHPQSPADTTFRKSHAVWWKIAGASEPTSWTSTMTGGAGGALVGFAEWAGTGLTNVALGAVVVAGSDTPASAYSSGTTAAVAGSSKLLIGFNFIKTAAGDERPYSGWAAGTDVLTEFIERSSAATEGREGSWAWGTSTASGSTHSVTATKDTGTADAGYGAITSLLVFTYGAPTGTNYPRTTTESVPVGDSVARSETNMVRATDDASVNGDTITARLAPKSRTTADVLVADDSTVAVVTKAPVLRSQTESVVVTDATARSSARSRALTEADPPVTDAVVRSALPTSRAITDAASASDATVPAAGKARAVADTATATDATARSPQALARAAAETRSVTDTVARASARQRSAGETAVATDANTRTSGRARAVGDVADASDDVQRSPQGLARAVADSAAVSETVGNVGTRSRAVADSASAADTTSASRTVGRATSDLADVTDATAQTASRARALAETRPVTDTVARTSTRPRALAETRLVTDTTARAAGARQRAVTEDIAVTDTLSASTTGQLQRATVENREVTDTVARTAGPKARAQAESRSVSDAVARTAPKQRSTTETRSVFDATSRGTSRSRTTADAVAAADTTARTVGRARGAGDAAETSDAVASVLGQGRGVLEAVPVADLSLAAMAQARQVLDSMAVTDTVFVMLGLPADYDIIVRPALGTYLVRPAAVGRRVAPAGVPFGVGAAPATYTVRR